MVGGGFSSSKSKTTSDSTGSYSKTSTPTNPEFVLSGLGDFGGQLQQLLGRDPTSFVAGATPALQQGIDAFSGLGGSAGGWINQAAGMAGAAGAGGPAMAAHTDARSTGYDPATATAAQIGPVSHAQAASAAGGIGSYMNPYEDQVVASTLSDMNRARQMANADNGRGAVLAGQYGGSRQGIAEGLTNGEFLRGVGSTVGALRHGGFGTALQYSNADADRSQQANLFNAGADNDRNLSQAQLEQQAALSNQAAANQAGQFGAAAQNQMSLANADAADLTSRFNAGQGDTALSRQLQAAQLLGGLGQYGLDGLMDAGGVQQTLAQRLAQSPLDLVNLLGDAWGSIPLGLLQGQTESGTETSSMKGTGKQSGFSLAAKYGG